MLSVSPAEILGYLASVTVGISLLMSDMVKLRIINLIGCILFVIYGIWIAAYPVAALNLFGVCVNLYQLFRLYKGRGQEPAQ